MLNPLYINQHAYIKEWEQDIYWANFKGHTPANNLREWRGVFGDYKKPFLIFTGTNHLPLNKLNLNNTTVDYLRKEGLRILSWEGLHYRLKDQDYNRGYFSEFTSDTPYSDIRTDELESIQEFADRYKLTDVRVFVGDHRCKDVVQQTYPSLNIIEQFLLVSRLKRYLDVKSMPEKDIKKTFFCTNNRYNFHRHLIMSVLSHYDGNYSWQFDVNDEYMNHINWFEKDLIDEKFMNMIIEGNKTLNREHLYLDFKYEKIKIFENFTHYYRTSSAFILSSANYNLYKKLINETFVTVVTETRYAQPIINTSEKCLIPVTNFSPFVIAGAPYLLSAMRVKLKMKTFSKYWDESYDKEENHTKRLDKIFKVLEFINDLSMDDKRAMYEDMKEILYWNQLQIVNYLTEPVVNYLDNPAFWISFNKNSE